MSGILEQLLSEMRELRALVDGIAGTERESDSSSNYWMSRRELAEMRGVSVS